MATLVISFFRTILSNLIGDEIQVFTAYRTPLLHVHYYVYLRTASNYVFLQFARIEIASLTPLTKDPDWPKLHGQQIYGNIGLSVKMYAFYILR